jgi:UDP-N-acetyl-D-mannosaminuronic acid dehydrogenase
MFQFDVCVVGGCGHVGLPLAIAFAESGLRVSIYDIDSEAVKTVSAGIMPFREEGAAELLRVHAGKKVCASTQPDAVAESRYVVVVIGTPVDEHLNPTFYAIRGFFNGLTPYLRDGQCIVLRSTVFPGTTSKVNDLLREAGVKAHVAYCPERIAEGHALKEFRTLPQIVSGCDDEATGMAASLFERLNQKVIRLEPLEAELAKVITNSWRYIQFAAANQFYMIAADYGLDFYRIYDAIIADYPRMSGLPRSGFAAGPCLLKDTMQLAAAYNNNFQLGHAAMLINEGLPNFIVRHLKTAYPLHEMRVGILGMSFKAESDDPRSSLSYKLRKIVEYEAREVVCSDEYICDPRFIPAEDLVDTCDLIILGAPHRRYRELNMEGRRVIDIWNFYGKGAAFQ